MTKLAYRGRTYLNNGIYPNLEINVFSAAAFFYIFLFCLIFAKQNVVAPLFDEPVEEVGDLYLDIADAYCETGKCYFKF